MHAYQLTMLTAVLALGAVLTLSDGVADGRYAAPAYQWQGGAANVVGAAPYYRRTRTACPPRVRPAAYLQRRSAGYLVGALGRPRFAQCRASALRTLCGGRQRRRLCARLYRRTYYRQAGNKVLGAKCRKNERRHFDTVGEQRDRMSVPPCRDLSRWNSLEPLPPVCDFEDSSPGRCFSYVATARYPYDPVDANMIRWNEGDPWKQPDYPNYWPYMVCANANMGRAATVDSERALAKLAALMPKEMSGTNCAHVDGYPKHWDSVDGEVRGTTARSEWVTSYAPHLPDERTPTGDDDVPMSTRVWAQKEPATYDKQLACACIHAGSKRIQSTRCEHWKWATCEYSRANPKYCIPLKDEPTRCFKLKRTAVQDYSEFWRKGDSNEFLARECHDRTPGRLANINTAEAQSLAAKLLAQDEALGQCVPVDGRPVHGADAHGRPLSSAGSADKGRWRAGGTSTPMAAQFWADEEPSGGKQTCACLYAYDGTNTVHDYDCNRKWSHIICEYRTTIGSVTHASQTLPAQDGVLGKKCDYVLYDHLWRTCESVYSGIYEFRCPGGYELQMYMERNKIDDCCEKNCKQEVFIYHCCFNRQLFNKDNTGDIQGRLLAKLKEHLDNA